MSEAPVDDLQVRVFEVATDRPESDGTLSWDSTTLIVVHARGAGRRGLGYTYGPAAIATLIADVLTGLVRGSDALSPRRINGAMRAALRNAGQGGVGAMALSAVDLALHDLRARVLDLPLARALGAVRERVPIYGSGGFTSYGPELVAEQLGAWAAQGIPRVKMKVGRHPDKDPGRLAAARRAIGPETALMVDANGAFTPDTALAWAQRYREYDVVYLEEPVSQDDLSGLRHVRERRPPTIAIASGEYSWSRLDAQRLLDAEAVDILQADVTRCGGLTELSAIDALCAARERPLSLHCAPAISAHASCALDRLLHLEYFHDHVRIERLLFDGVPELRDGALAPDLARPGHGLELKEADARRYER
jgi:L-alanine-DL-glutamate epimerase-like enolase superfamily enzyme